MLVDNFPEPARVRISRNTFKHQCGSAIGQWTIDNVGVSGNPSHVCGAPVDITIVIIKHIFVCHRSIKNVTTSGV